MFICILCFLIDKIDAITHLGESGVAHRDLKTENTIVNPDTLVVKLIDFSHASHIASINDMDDGYRGTPIYMAPEVLARTGRLYSIIPADMWSAGVIFWECLIGYNPFESAHSVNELRKNHKNIPQMTNGLGKAARLVVRKVLNLEPRLRPTPHEAKNLLRELFPTWKKTPFIDYERNYSARRSLSSMYSSEPTSDCETMAVERHLSDR